MSIKVSGNNYFINQFCRGNTALIFPLQNLVAQTSLSESFEIPLPESFECLFDPQRSFGNPLRTLFLKNRDFFSYSEIFVPNTRGPLGCLLRFWPSGPKPCGGNKSSTIVKYCDEKAQLPIQAWFLGSPRK